MKRHERQDSLTDLPTAPPSTTQPSLTCISDLAISLHTTSGMVPPPLAGASLTIVDHTLYLFGGRLVSSRRMTNELFSLNMHTFVWRHHANLPGDPPPEPRYFHSANCHNDKIIYFGGMGQQRSEEGRDTGVVLGDLYILYTKPRLRWWKPSMLGVAPRARYAHLTVIDHSRMVIIGGQDLQNQYIEDCNVLDISKLSWVRNIEFTRHCGAYRSVAVRHEGKCIVYSNYNFVDVKRELLQVDTASLHMKEIHEMTGDQQPPGLRFPLGHRLGDKLIMSGTYLTNSSHSFCVWQLNLTTFKWSRLFIGKIESGSWNRAVLDPGRDRYLIFGNRNRQIMTDYEQRRVNFEHLVVVRLDAWGIYEQPRVRISLIGQQLGTMFLEDEMFSDFMLVSNDGHTLKVNSSVLRRRWPYFTQQTEISDSMMVSETITVLHAFVKFLYTDAVTPELSLSVLGELLCMAEGYNMDRLAKRVAVQMQEQLDAKNAWNIFCFARRAGNLGLQVRALKVMESREGRTWLEQGESWWTDPSEEEARDEVVQLVGVKYRKSMAMN